MSHPGWGSQGVGGLRREERESGEGGDGGSHPTVVLPTPQLILPLLVPPQSDPPRSDKTILSSWIISILHCENTEYLFYFPPM